jgi:hypothetical protein
VQGLLLEWGRRTGHEVWVAKGDRGRVVDGACLGSRTLERIPTCLPARVYSVLEHVDTIWFPLGGAVPVALFEVEHSTSILGGLLRMNDVVMSLVAPVEGWRFFIVAPARRLSRFSSELARPTFQASGLARLCRFLSYDEVLDGSTDKKPLR